MFKLLKMFHFLFLKFTKKIILFLFLSQNYSKTSSQNLEKKKNLRMKIKNCNDQVNILP